MENNLCIKCGGKGFNTELKGQVLAHSDYAVKADLYKVSNCQRCGGYGIEPFKLRGDSVFWFACLLAVSLGMFFYKFSY